MNGFHLVYYKKLSTYATEYMTSVDLLLDISLAIKSPRPGWSDMLQVVQIGEHPGISSTLFLTMIDLNPGDTTCIYPTMMHADKYNAAPA